MFFCGYVQRGSDGMILLGGFAVKYGTPLVDTVENMPPDWYTVGHQNTMWEMFGYIPTDWVDPPGPTGLPTWEASRAWEELTAVQYALGDFMVRQVAIALDKSVADVANVTTNGFSDPPNACSPVDPVGHSCVRRTDNNIRFYVSSFWEYSFFAPHSMSMLVGLMGGPAMFICVSFRTDTAAFIADEVLAVRLALGLARAV
ncbi:hypothetical protein B0H14DRAFT_3460987 [Mycena olivaceomarginata]|nr:hypothetical protein B0H14DRAFT_3460987 [Mycena olivaceomarginata]